MDLTAVTVKGACAELATAFQVNIWLGTALNPSFSVVKVYQPLLQRDEDFQRSKMQHVESYKLH